jgi:hypothetical protein
VSYLLSSTNLSVPRWLVASTIGAAIAIAGWKSGALRSYSRNVQDTLKGAKSSTADLERAAPRYLKLQQSVPPGATLLVRLSRPFLLDFSRNRIYTIDWPGGAGLAPGMPCFAGSDALADYMLANFIRYVAYDYREEAGFRRSILQKRLLPTNPSFRQTAARLTFDFQDNLQELGRTRRKLYDDGSAFVVDLQTPSSGDPQN